MYTLISSQRQWHSNAVTTKKHNRRLTLIPQCEPTHLWKVFERLQADHSSKHFKSDNGDLVLFDEAWSNSAFFVRLLVNEAQQRLSQSEQQQQEHDLSLSMHLYQLAMHCHYSNYTV